MMIIFPLFLVAREVIDLTGQELRGPSALDCSVPLPASLVSLSRILSHIALPRNAIDLRYMLWNPVNEFPPG